MAQNPIPTDWDEMSWCTFEVCWPDSVLWRGLLAGLLTSPGRGRYWDAKTGTITEAQAVGQQILEANSYFQEVCMSCEEAVSVADAINAAIAGIASGGAGCGCGSSGAGGTEQPGSTENPGVPGDQVGDPPTGFDTWAEYETYKCDIATMIVERVQTDLAWMEIADIVTLTATSLAFALITPIPFDDVVAVLGFIAALALQGVFIDAIQDMQAAVLADFDDLVCSLYSAPNIDGAKEQWNTQIDASIDAQTADIYAPIEKIILHTMATNDALNSLFDRNTALEAVAPVGDCAECELSCPQYTVTRGTETSPGNFSSENTGEGDHVHRVSIAPGCRDDVTDCGGSNIFITLTSIDGWTGVSASAFRISSDNCFASVNPDVVNDDDPNDHIDISYCSRGWMIASLTPWTAEITIGADC